MSLPEGISKVVLFTSKEDKELGLKRFGEHLPVPADTVFVFPDCQYPTNFTTMEMHHRIRGYALRGASDHFSIITRYEMDPGSMIGVDERVKHFVETAVDAPVIKNFEFLKDYLK